MSIPCGKGAAGHGLQHLYSTIGKASPSGSIWFVAAGLQKSFAARCCTFSEFLSAFGASNGYNFPFFGLADPHGCLAM